VPDKINITDSIISTMPQLRISSHVGRKLERGNDFLEPQSHPITITTYKQMNIYHKEHEDYVSILVFGPIAFDRVMILSLILERLGISI
jgi:hypothetical protein